MKLGKTQYIKNREKWRRWLEKNHKREQEIWLIYYKRHTGKPSIPYNDAVEEALCFGWIDSTVKGINKDKYAQRFSPRRAKSLWSQMNKERMKRLIKLKKVSSAGLAAFNVEGHEVFKIPLDIAKVLMKDKKVWLNFQKFPESYKRIRIGWIDGVRKRPEEFKKRLKYFLKKTANNETFGMVK